MIKKKSFTAAFTLIELLVVITIIGILAGIALPVFNSVQTKGLQTKCLASAKQIGLALKLFAGDNNSSYPTQGVPGGTTGMGAITSSNQAFSALFPTYIQSETIFYNRAATGFTQAAPPDNVLDAAGTYSNGQTLKGGENAYAYMDGLSDTDNSSYPLISDAFSSPTSGTFAASGNGSTWKGQKAIVIHLDNSGSVDTLTASGTTYIDNGNTGQAAQGNLFVKRAAAGGTDAGWLTDLNQVVNPISGTK